ncbi:MAG: 1-deoxy-D-xylulose-5-phosphate synthase [Oscillospiraceae bacterium]|nr:1-deoxy-D-xylulose-5-phosphate synthase [Oscillospiraceae bacterium]
MNKNILYNINFPEDLKKIKLENLDKLAEDIREFLIYSISKTGGHLASNLGVVDITLAMHYVFDSPKDKFVFDVGHQCYTHKILTGRKKLFNNLRKSGGLSGFPKPSESMHDAFIAGHSSTSISAAYGMDAGYRLQKKDMHSVVLIGDGAFTGGMPFEALNNIGRDDNSNVIIIFNNNDMSISPNVGSFAKYITGIRSKESYLKIKKSLENILGSSKYLGPKIKNTLSNSKNLIKDMVYHGNFFEDMGLNYIGPIDGHNISHLVNILNYAKQVKKPIVIHIETTKGKGYEYAEQDPVLFHGIPKFDKITGDPDISSCDSFSVIVGKEIKSMADKNPKICGITAAMTLGTGLQFLKEYHPDRFFDVGIAEQHGTTFCGGLSSSGMIPIFCVYSTFLQRGFDQLIHDICIDKKKVIFAVDRAGIVGDDGETHQGIFDVSYSLMIPNITIFSPSNYQECKDCLNFAVDNINSPVIIRYPKGSEGKRNESIKNQDRSINYTYINNNHNILVVCYGRIFDNVLKAYKLLFEQGVSISILKIIKLKPVEDEILNIICKYKKVFFFEEGIQSGGLGEHILYKSFEIGFRNFYKIIAIKDIFIEQGDINFLFKKLGFDAESICKTILNKEK